MKKQTRRTYSDIEAYIAALSDEEQQRVTEAEQAIDIACLLYKARVARGLTQGEAGTRANITQQMVSKLERAGANIEIDTLLRYVRALGYHLTITLEDRQTTAEPAIESA